MRWWRFVTFLSIGALAACGGDDPAAPGEEGVSESELTFIRFPEATLPLVTRDTSFWAVRGQSRELVLRYQPVAPGEEGDEFLVFKVPGDGLLRRPNGTRFAVGDSVQIRLQVDDAGRFLFHFEPAGLAFDPDHPAELKVAYREVEDDLDGDGDIDDDDLDLEGRLDLWRQDRPGEPWYRLATVKVEDLDEAEARIFHFSRFALASN